MVLSSPGASIFSGEPIDLTEASVGKLALAIARHLSPSSAVADRIGTVDPVEQVLDQQIDQYRDLIKVGSPRTALALLKQLLDRLPATASSIIRFRIKATIGHCYVQLQDDAEAEKWLLEAYEVAPTEPKAIANKAFAMIVGNRPRDAYFYCCDALANDPHNEWIAAHLHRSATLLEDVDDPQGVIPAELLGREEVILSRIIYLRGRERRPDWWELARRAAKSFPNNNHIAVSAAEGAVDEGTQHPDFQRDRRLPEDLEGRVVQAAAVLEEHWKQLDQSEVPRRPDGLSALANAMIAHQVVGDFKKAVSLARELVTRVTDEQTLTSAFHVAHFSDEYELAKQAIDAIANPSPVIQFFRALLLLDQNRWDDAAAFLKTADVPATERALAATIIQLAPLRDRTTDMGEAEFRNVFSVAGQDPRSLVALARIADFRGFVDVAREAYEKAVSFLDADSSLVSRSMVASYSAQIGDAAKTIDILDGHVSIARPNRELLWLAEAHASEQPRRQRNLKFFEALPAAVRTLPEYARAYGNVLLDHGRLMDAEQVFRGVIRERPQDVFAILRLGEALRRSDRLNDFKSIVVATDEYGLRGPVENRIVFAHELLNAGEGLRALRFGYHLVQKFSRNPKVAMGYVGLTLIDKRQDIIPAAPVVAVDTWVSLRDENGHKNEFIIDTGSPFLGIDVHDPNHELVKKISGLKPGDTVEFPRPYGPAETWTIAEVKSKYLHVLHVLLNDFERRYPGHGGIWRFTVNDGDVSAVLDMVRQQSEANRELAKSYTEKQLPLAFVARLMGGDAASFAQYLTTIGSEVITCVGTHAERGLAIDLATAARGKGVALDDYTAWVAAEMGVLDILKSWFGRLLIAQSTIDAIEHLIQRQQEGLGQQVMTIAWHDGQYVRQEITDEFIQQRIAALRTLKNDMVIHCDIVSVALPDTIADFAANIARMFGPHMLDPVYLAIQEEVPLLSDDLRYRQVGRIIGATADLWLQAALMVALNVGVADQARVIKAYVHLAARKHRHVSLDPFVLRKAYEMSDDSLTEFDIITDFIGTNDADMMSHTKVAAGFVWKLWEDTNGDTRAQKATSIIFGKLLRHRPNDWAKWLAVMPSHGDVRLTRYLVGWLQGHFLPVEPVDAAISDWRRQSQRTRRIRLSGPSPLALRIGMRM